MSSSHPHDFAPLNAGEGKRFPVLGYLLFLLYGIHSVALRSLIRWMIYKLEGGTLYSITLRRIYARYHEIEIGMYSSTGCFIPNNYRKGTKIGRYCAIAQHSYAFNANHPMNTKSVHSFFYNPCHGFIKEDLLTRTQLTIGNDVFIGHNAIILPSVSTIGDGAIIGAGAVVHTDIPPYAVVVGHPCRVVRYRFSKRIIGELIDSKWWEKPIAELLPDMESFQRPLENGTAIM